MNVKKIPELYEHQIEALEFIRDKDYFALFMEMGTGKSKVAIEKAYALYTQGKINSVIIISPNSLKEQWVEEQFEIHYLDYNWTSYIWDGANTKKSKERFFNCLKEDNKLCIFSFNVEAYQWDSIDIYLKMILKEKEPFIIVDESTRIKNGRRKNRGKRGGAKRTNKILDYFEHYRYKCILTGTPITKSPFDLWSQFEFLKKDYFSMDYFFFTHHYGILLTCSNNNRTYKKVLDEVTYNKIKHNLDRLKKPTHNDILELSYKYGLSTKDILNIKKMKKYSGFKNLPELKRKISEITFFKKKSECLDLPDKVYSTLKVSMGKEQKKIYETLKKEMYAEYSGEELTLTNKVVMVIRLSQITGGQFPYSETDIKILPDGEEIFETNYITKPITPNAKLNVLLEDLEDVPKEISIIIWARFRGEIEFICEELVKLNYTCEKYYGGSSYEIIKRFKNREFQILVASPLKGDVGLNLQVSTLHYFYSNSFKADTRFQAEDRSHRSGQKNKVLYKDLICTNTIDEKIYRVLQERKDLIEYFSTKDIKEILE